MCCSRSIVSAGPSGHCCGRPCTPDTAAHYASDVGRRRPRFRTAAASGGPTCGWSTQAGTQTGLPKCRTARRHRRRIGRIRSAPDRTGRSRQPPGHGWTHPGPGTTCRGRDGHGRRLGHASRGSLLTAPAGGTATEVCGRVTSAIAGAHRPPRAKAATASAPVMVSRRT